MDFAAPELFVVCNRIFIALHSVFVVVVVELFIIGNRWLSDRYSLFVMI